MSQAQAHAGNAELVDSFEEFFRKYYDQEVRELASRYPKEQQSLYVDWMDLYRFDPDLADDWLNQPTQLERYANEALRIYDLPIDITLNNATVRVHNLNDGEIFSPSELRSEHGGKYVGIKGELSRVTKPTDKPEEVAFECQLCGVITRIPQGSNGLTEPHECQGCQRQGPFQPNHDQSEWTDYCKVRIETPPDKTGDVGKDEIDGFVEGDLVDEGHETHGLLARAGDRCTVYGVVERQQKTGQKQNDLLFDRILHVKAIDFDDDENDVRIEEHKDEFMELADRDDAVDTFAKSIVPEMYATPEWEYGLQFAVAYLFGAPRIDIDGGPTYRGDIHGLIISGYGMNKSTFNAAVEQYSPKCINKSVTGLSSDVGLLAAATRDDFGEGQWTIKPGILVRGNGGHVILDEIDKTDADLERMNDALEGKQMVDVDKAGESVTYQSRMGLMATGNPTGSRFNKYDPVSEQIGMGESLLSRFDGIITMRDSPDVEIDSNIAGKIINSIAEAQEVEYGDRDRDDLDVLDRVVTPEVGRAWIAYARENVYPMISTEKFERVKDWYAEEIRPMNKSFADDEGEGRDMPVPVNPRDVLDVVRFAMAFARVNLRDEVADEDVDRAMNLKKTLVGQTFDGEKFVPHEQQQPQSQEEEYEEIKELINDLAGAESGAHIDDIIELGVERGMDENSIEHKIEKLKQSGQAYEPQTDTFRTTD